MSEPMSDERLKHFRDCHKHIGMGDCEHWVYEAYNELIDEVERLRPIEKHLTSERDLYRQRAANLRAFVARVVEHFQIDTWGGEDDGLSAEEVAITEEMRRVVSCEESHDPQPPFTGRAARPADFVIVDDPDASRFCTVTVPFTPAGLVTEGLWSCRFTFSKTEEREVVRVWRDLFSPELLVSRFGTEKISKLAEFTDFQFISTPGVNYAG